MIKHISALTAMAACILSCNNYSVVERIDIKPLVSRDNLNDSIFFGDISEIVEYSSELYFLDYTTGEIIVSDTDFNYKRGIGKVGNAHNEYMDVSSFSISGDTVLVNDSGHSRFQAYDTSGNHLFSYNYSRLLVGFSERFAFKDNHVTISSRDSAYVEIDISCENKFELSGKRINFKDSKQNAIRNYCSFFYFEDKIISISDNLPIIRIYDKKGLTETSYDYQSIEFVDKQMKYSESQQESSNTYFVLVSDCYVYKNRIYILVAENTNQYMVNKIVVFQIDNHNINIEKILILNGERYGALSVSDNNMFVFNLDENTIEKYLIN